MQELVLPQGIVKSTAYWWNSWLIEPGNNDGHIFAIHHIPFIERWLLDFHPPE